MKAAKYLCVLVEHLEARIAEIHARREAQRIASEERDATRVEEMKARKDAEQA